MRARPIERNLREIYCNSEKGVEFKPKGGLVLVYCMIIWSGEHIMWVLESSVDDDDLSSQQTTLRFYLCLSWAGLGWCSKGEQARQAFASWWALSALLGLRLQEPRWELLSSPRSKTFWKLLENFIGNFGAKGNLNIVSISALILCTMIINCFFICSWNFFSTQVYSLRNTSRIAAHDQSGHMH